MRQTAEAGQGYARAPFTLGSATRKGFPPCLPASTPTGESGESFAELAADALETRIARAHAAWREGRLTDFDTRTALLERIVEQFEAKKRQLAELATREMGKTLKSAIAEVENAPPASAIMRRRGRACSHRGNFRATATWHAMGPVLAVMPWKFSCWQVVRFLAPTIMAGNVGLLNTPRTSRAAVRRSSKW